MDERHRAEAHLRVIRSLMERATIYRAIAVPSALLGGLLAVAVGAWLYVRPVAAPWVLLIWLAVLAVTISANLLFLWRDARRRGEPFVSRGMREALASLAPSFLVAGVITWLARAQPTWVSLAWGVCYGVALLACRHFAPRSMNLLGKAFLIISLALAVLQGCGNWEHPLFDEYLAPAGFLNLFMAGTFGFLHVLYAAFTWRATASTPDVTSLSAADV